MVDFEALKNLYNSQMDSLLSQSGLTSQVTFLYDSNKKNLCPNCIFDVSLKKSANKYKSGGPIPFDLGRICPYCNGAGYDADSSSSDGYLAIVWDYKKWINPPPDIAQPDGMIQTICNKSYLSNIKQCKSMNIIYPGSNNKPHKFILYGEPNPCGLGDNNYIMCMWKKVN